MAKLEYYVEKSCGIDPKAFEKAHSVLIDAIDNQAAPGAVALVLYQKRIIARFAYGKRALLPEPEDLTFDTIYDLASLTKCIGTTTACMMLLERGLIKLDDSIYKFLPEFKDKRRVKILQLLTHTSGFSAWLPLYNEAEGREDYKKALAKSDLEYCPGSKVVYTCLGYILLGLIIEKVAGEALDVFLEKELFVPLDMKDTSFNPKQNLSVEKQVRIAPTESTKQRGLLKGEVHDENAYAIGGVSGNAGLFSTADDLASYALMLLAGGTYNSKRILSKDTVDLMTKNHTAPLTPGRGLGWMKKNPNSSGGALLTLESYGHTGFTGTSMWLDPAFDLAIILLTNQVHPDRNKGGVGNLRVSFANAVVSGVPRV
ncbi:MAG: serine hydrolase [Firmicutes bacterium]|nr:serine hydrolase [Bacillota bacterium]